MFDFFQPSQKPTLSERAILFLFVAAVFIVLEVAALVIRFRAPAAKHELAVELEYRGAWCLGIRVAMALGVRLYRRLFD